MRNAAQMVKNPPAMWETGLDPWTEIPWTEKPGELQSIGSQRVGHE